MKVRRKEADLAGDNRGFLDGIAVSKKKDCVAGSVSAKGVP
jgi:hypothetical protein